MKRAKTIVLGLACFVLYGGFHVYTEASLQSENDALEALLDERNVDEKDSDEAFEALVSAIASNESAYEDAQARIAQLEQLLADREAIILQLSDDHSDVDVEALQRENAILAEALEEALAQRDQIREDFNRLFEGGEFAQPAVDGEDVSAEDEALHERVQQLKKRLTVITDQLEAVLEERDSLATRVAVFEEELEAEREQRKAALQAQKDMFAEQRKAALEAQKDMYAERLQTASEEKQALTAALEESERARVAMESALEAGPSEVESLAQELASLRALDASRRVTMDELMVQAGTLREQLRTLESENAQLREDLEGLTVELADNAVVLAERDARIESLRQERDDKEKLLAGAWEKIEAQAVEMGELRGVLGKRDAELAESRESYVALERAYQETQTTLAGARSDIDQLKVEIESLREQKDNRVASLRETQQELERTLLVDERRRRVLDETLEKLAEVENREEVLLTEREAYREEVARLTSDRDSLKGELDELALQASDLQTRLDEVTASAHELRTSLTDREQELANKVATVATLEKRVATLDADAKAALAKHDTAQQDLLAAQKALSEKEQELTAAVGELEKVRLVDDRRRRTLDDTITALAFAEQRQAELEALVASSDDQLMDATESARQEVARLRERNQLLEKEVSQIENDLRRAEARAATVAPVVDDTIDDRIAVLQNGKAELREALRLAEQSGDDPAVREALLRQLHEQEHRADEATAEVASLIAQLEDAQSTIAQLTAEPDASQTQVLELREELQVLQAELEAATAALAEKEEALRLAQQEVVPEIQGDIRETDLYLELEADLALVRDRLIETESERQRLRRSVEQLQEDMSNQQAELLSLQRSKDATSADLALAKEREEDYRELLDRLVPEVRSLEEKLTDLRREREQIASRLLQREDEIEALHVELEQREHRLARAERVAEVLERTRSEVEQAQRKQRLNMHYNMAAVYARDGRYAEAEYEYLQALRLDPSDADVHFNLGILYDDELGQPDKAILHYRRYLQLNPHGVDADRVRSWLMRLEMDQRR